MLELSSSTIIPTLAGDFFWWNPIMGEGINMSTPDWRSDSLVTGGGTRCSPTSEACWTTSDVLSSVVCGITMASLAYVGGVLLVESRALPKVTVFCGLRTPWFSELIFEGVPLFLEEASWIITLGSYGKNELILGKDLKKSKKETKLKYFTSIRFFEECGSFGPLTESFWADGGFVIILFFVFLAGVVTGGREMISLWSLAGELVS